jgi:flavin reductase (DIM6/NTAB) family NADH-FMN oxidoreductase RutF/DNA-binding IclR family transcriptional regulator
MTNTTEPTITAPDFRRALGHYPTGVAVITARQAEGSPVGMVIGTFTSVSLDPQLVGFLADRRSSSWSRIREAGSFCVNVLSSEQEHVCRAFAGKEHDRFTVHCRDDAASGSPLLSGALMWIDCDIESVLPAGDHDMVLGRVRDLGVAEDVALPLLFLRGGYGAPLLPSIQVEAPELGAQLRLADLVRAEAEQISRDLDLECLVGARVDESVVVLATAGIGRAPGGSATRLGSTFPLDAPFGLLYVAWSADVEREAWLTRGRRSAGPAVTALAEAELRTVRDLGYEVTTGRAMAERFDRLFSDSDDPDGVTEILSRLTARGPEPGLRAPVEELVDVTSLAAPVRDQDGRVVMALRLLGFSGSEPSDRLRTCLDRLRAGAVRASELLQA